MGDNNVVVNTNVVSYNQDHASNMAGNVVSYSPDNTSNMAGNFGSLIKGQTIADYDDLSLTSVVTIDSQVLDTLVTIQRKTERGSKEKERDRE